MGNKVEMAKTITCIILALLLSQCSPFRAIQERHQTMASEVTLKVLTDKELQGKCRISGFVSSRDWNMPLGGATVRLTDEIDVMTDKNGEFQLDISPGVYRFHIEYMGHPDLQTTELQLTANQHAIIVFELGAIAGL